MTLVYNISINWFLNQGLTLSHLSSIKFEEIKSSERSALKDNHVGGSDDLSAVSDDWKG